ncbi:MAG: nitronate monooxygenase [Gammaproteobacteria bacterium]|jgi:nitronate monooxygenase
MITTKLTEKLDLQHPIIQAPMAIAAGGALASAVSKVGGLGLIGGGYGDPDWIRQQFTIADSDAIGCGLITWALDKNPGLLDDVLAYKPAALFLSFGDPQSYVHTIKNASVTLICQVQTLKDARHALDIGADVIVAQGAEAGGHGEKRTTLTLVPEVADLISTQFPQALLCAAGGIADGRGLAAALMLGADGVVIGSRFWATQEALVHPNMHDRALSATGDQTIRSSVMDIARHLDWPERYTARVIKNSFTEKWHDDVEGLKAVADEEAARWKAAWINGEMDIANTFVGEAAGLIADILPAEECLLSIVNEAENLLKTRSN